MKLGILPNSHNVVTFQGADKFQAAIEFKFKLGEIILINPLLVHYGCAYLVNEKNLRAHYYFDNPDYEEEKKRDYERQTFFFNAPVTIVPKTPAKIKNGGRKKSRRGDNKRRKPNIGGLA